MAIDIFGFSIGKKNPTDPIDQQIEKTNQKSFVAPDSYDGTYTIESGGVFGTMMDFTGSVRDENQLIGQFRNMALFPEVTRPLKIL